ncbi:MAG: hypothetical protein RL378_698, partial [Actinomycetota bacterium]
MSRIGLPQVTPGDRATHVFPGTDVTVESLPKISLHDHLDGGLRPSTIVELAAAGGIEIPHSTPNEL